MDKKAAFKKFTKATRAFFRGPGQLEADLVAAARSNDVPKAQALIADGAKVSSNRYGAGNALDEAVTAGHLDMVKFLLAAGADPNATLRYGRETPFINAVRTGSVEMASAMLDAGAAVNTQGARYDTALILAVFAKNRPMIDLLLDKGADVNIRNESRWRPLSYAMHNGDGGLINLLLKKGARTNVVDIDRRTLFDIAEAADKPAARLALQDFMDARVQEWQKLDAQTVAHVKILRPLGYKLTEVFNFETSQCTILSHNFVTGRDALETRPFAQFGEEALNAARAKLGTDGKAEAAAPKPAPAPGA